MACGHCKGVGHTRPTCPIRKAERDARVAKPVEPHAECLPRHTGSPWTHVGRAHGASFVVQHTWRHNVTGEIVTASVPVPPSGCPTDTSEGIIALRRPLDVFAYIAREMPSAVVTHSAASPAPAPSERPKSERAAAQPAPAAAPEQTVRADDTGWGMW